jgi:hypothetical protein
MILKEEVNMNENVQSTSQDTWVSRFWQTLAALDATDISPIESIERRLSALEQRVWNLKEDTK